MHLKELYESVLVETRLGEALANLRDGSLRRNGHDDGSRWSPRSPEGRAMEREMDRRLRIRVLGPLELGSPARASPSQA